MRLALISPAAVTLIDAARCWRRASDLGEPRQPALVSAFRNSAETLLVPVIDGLLTLFEAAFRRRFEAGAPADDEMTSDEERLLELLAVGDAATPAGVCPSLVGALGAAVRSTRIMMRSVLPRSPEAAE